MQRVSSKTRTRSSDSLPQTSKPYVEIAKYLISSGASDFKTFKLGDIESVISRLAVGQSTLKSVDGVSHHLSNKFKDTSSLTSRLQKFGDSDKKDAKEAGKLLEYVNAVELSLQACEILQACYQTDAGKYSDYLDDAGLEKIFSDVIKFKNLKCGVHILRPKPETVLMTLKKSKYSRRFHGEELVVAITDLTPLPKLLSALSKDPKTLSLQSAGFVEEEVSIQLAIYEIALRTLNCLSPHIQPLPPPLPANESSNNTVNGPDSSASSPPMLTSSPITRRRSVDLERPSPTTAVAAKTSVAGNPLPSRIRIVGHSLGGSIAALACSVLDGSLNASHPDNVLEYCGLFRKGYVKALCLGPAPCLSRAIVPRSVTSIICGDDVVPRASPEALRHLQQRTLKSAVAMKSFSPLGWIPVGDWVSDAAAIAGKGLRNYASGSHDLSSLNVPGRVFFVKTRKLKQGASLQRVLRGNWKEDLLWTLHDILLSPRMIEHHSLESYIRCLSRC